MKRNYIFVMACFLTVIFNTHYFSQTIIGGFIASDQTWTVSGSPYLVQSNTLVNDGVTLTIQPGVSVKFGENIQILMRGKLIAHGTQQDSIYFLKSGANNWSTIALDNNGHSPKADVRFLHASGAGSVFNILDIYGQDTLLKISRSVFSQNQYVITGDDYEKEYKTYIDSSYFSSNTNYVGMYISNAVILNSRFADNYGGIYSSASQDNIINNCIFSGTTNAAVSTEGFVTNCEFFGNGLAIVTMYDGPQIHYNNIHDNAQGIVAYNYGGPNPINQITNNRICNNTLNVRKVYDSETYITNNCWCLNDSAAIAATIQDFFTGGQGFVFFTPFDEDCSSSGPHLSVTEKSGNQPEFRIYPNPTAGVLNLETDLTATSIRLLDISGQILKIVDPKGLKKSSLDMNEMKTGVYLLEIVTGNQRIVEKIVKE